MCSVALRYKGRPWASYVRISVRALIDAVLIIGAGMGWLVRRSQAQRDAVAAVKRAGGNVRYEWEYHTPNIKAPPWRPKWLMEWVGVDYFGNVVYVNYRRGAQDADLTHVGRLDRLARLDVSGPGVTDAGLAHLHALARLEYLTPRSFVKYLADLPSLR
jgi:internalin A